MNLRLRLTPLVLSAALSVNVSSYAGMARADALDQALLRIDLSGRQRMLSQRIAGLSCLVYMDIDAQTHAREILETRDLFSRTLQDLLTGEALVGLDAEDEPRILDSLARARDSFMPMVDLLTVFEGTATISKPRLQAISAQSGIVFSAADALTNQIQAVHTRELEELSLITAMIINISGRQRMLAEKLFKQVCLSQAGIEVERNLDELRQTILIFDNTVSALINGMPGVIAPPPTPEIKAKLEQVHNIWLPVKDILDRAVAGEAILDDELGLTAEALESIRMRMNEAVKLYDEAEEAG